MQETTMIHGILLASIIGFIGLNIKNIINFIYVHVKDLFVYSVKIEESSQFFYFLQKYVISEHNEKIHNSYYKTFYDNYIVEDNQINEKLFFSFGYVYFKFNNKRILIYKDNQTIENSLFPYKNNKQVFKIFSFNKKVINEFLEYVDEKYGKATLKIYFNDNGSVSLLSTVTTKSFDNIFLNDNLVETIKNDIDNFINHKEKYIQLGLKYKRVYLFYGEAGTGKSSLTNAIANYTKRDVLSINKSKEMTDETLIKLIANRPDKSIISFEDIDCLFENLNRDDSEDKESDKKEKITLSCILNILDGSYTPNDTIFVLTTNHIDKLDEAIKRDGRTNLMLNITKPNNETKLKYIDYLKQFKPDFNVDLSNIENKTLSSIEKIFINY